jgi:predicted RNase H-like nuclease
VTVCGPPVSSAVAKVDKLFVAGVDGCRGGWVAFKVELPARVTSVELIDLPAWLRERPPDLACVGIDIPIGLLEDPRATQSKKS